MVEKYLKAEEVAAMLGLSKAKVLELARKGEMHCKRLNKRTILFTLSDIEKFQKGTK